MALRPLDNALPIAQERPKKQVKGGVISTTKQQVDLGLNDENKAPLPQVSNGSSDASIDYIPSENLKSVVDPEIKIQDLIGDLESKDWLKVCESLNDARRFAIYHSDLLLPILDRVMMVIIKAMKNPRSALCKTSIMASSDIFKAFADKLLDSATTEAFDQLVLQLLLKASQDKKFVCEEADRAIKSMVEAMNPPLPLLNKLQGYVNHSNPRIRAKAAVSISLCVSRMEIEGIEEFGLISLAQMAAELLNDRLPDAREAARSIVSSLYNKAFTEKEEEEEEKKEEAWQSFCQSNMSALHAQAMIKLISA